MSTSFITILQFLLAFYRVARLNVLARILAAADYPEY